MTKFDHRRDLRGLAYDEVDNDDGADANASPLMKEDGSPIVDSAKAHRILSGCVGRLSNDDMLSVADMLKSADLIDASELAALKTAMSGGGDGGGADPTPAMDSAIMSRRRAQVAAGLRPASDLRLPIERAPSAADIKRRKEMFPGWDKIKDAS